MHAHTERQIKCKFDDYVYPLFYHLFIFMLNLISFHAHLYIFFPNLCLVEQVFIMFTSATNVIILEVLKKI